MSEEDYQVSFPIYGDVDDSIKVSRRLRDEPRLTHKGVSFRPKRWPHLTQERWFQNGQSWSCFSQTYVTGRERSDSRGRDSHRETWRSRVQMIRIDLRQHSLHGDSSLSLKVAKHSTKGFLQHENCIRVSAFEKERGDSRSLRNENFLTASPKPRKDCDSSSS